MSQSQLEKKPATVIQMGHFMVSLLFLQFYFGKKLRVLVNPGTIS